jgi:ferredoxin
MDTQIIIDSDVCVGYGECIAEDAEAVELDDNGCAHALVPLMTRERAERLCAVCPVGAISLRSASAA